MLSTTSKYALRALSHLAHLPDGRAVLGRELASTANIPANYLSKILVALRNAGLVDTARGSGGGYRLHKAAEDIYLIDVVELFEDVSRTQPACFLHHQKPCTGASPCGAHALWRDLQAAYLGFLISTPLSAIAGGASHMAPPVRPRRAEAWKGATE